MKKGSTIFLRLTVGVMALVVLALCVFALPSAWKGGPAEFPYADMAIKAIVCILYASVVPYFIALWQTMKLLGYIDHNKAFSDLSVNALRTIKRCGIAIALLFGANAFLLYPIAEYDDAPGLLLMGAAIACAPVVIAVFAAVLQRLLQNAIDMKSENDLTV